MNVKGANAHSSKRRRSGISLYRANRIDCVEKSIIQTYRFPEARQRRYALLRGAPCAMRHAPLRGAQ
jgi:hypothetical protein